MVHGNTPNPLFLVVDIVKRYIKEKMSGQVSSPVVPHYYIPKRVEICLFLAVISETSSENCHILYILT